MADEEAISGLLKLTKAPSAREELAVDAMIDLKNINQDPLKLEENEQQEIIRAAYALLDLSKIDVNVLKEQLSQIDDEIIDENVDFLVQSGILPPIDVIVGGAKTANKPRVIKNSQTIKPILADKPKQAVTPGRVTRGQTGFVSPPTIKDIENKETENLIKQQEEQARQQEEESLKQLQETRLEGLTTWDSLPEIIKNVDVCEHNSASIVMRILFPKDVVDAWVNKKKTCRNIFDLSEVEAQCKNVVPPKEPINDNCYICGFEFNEKEEGLQRTCEHILPIIQAVFFLELYTKGKTVNPVLLLEYDWAHRCCNYVKNDYSFLKTVMRNKYPAYEFNSNQTSVTLSLIQDIKEISEKTKQPKFIGLNRIQERIVEYEKESIKKWKQDRFNYIRDSKMDPIVKHIASHGDNGIALMIGFRNCLDSKNIHSKFLELLSQSSRKEKPTLSIRKNKTNSAPKNKTSSRVTKRMKFSNKGGKTFETNNNVEFIHSSSRSGKKGSSRKTARINRRK